MDQPDQAAKPPSPRLGEPSSKIGPSGLQASVRRRQKIRRSGHSSRKKTPKKKSVVGACHTNSRPAYFPDQSAFAVFCARPENFVDILSMSVIVSQHAAHHDGPARPASACSFVPGQKFVHESAFIATRLRFMSIV